MGVAQALIDELVEVVVVEPAYMGGSPVSVLLEAEHDADSVIVKEAVTVIVSAEAVVISAHGQQVSYPSQINSRRPPVEKLLLVVVSVAVAVVVSVRVPVE